MKVPTHGISSDLSVEHVVPWPWVLLMRRFVYYLSWGRSAIAVIRECSITSVFSANGAIRVRIRPAPARRHRAWPGPHDHADDRRHIHPRRNRFPENDQRAPPPRRPAGIGFAAVIPCPAPLWLVPVLQGRMNRRRARSPPRVARSCLGGDWSLRPARCRRLRQGPGYGFPLRRPRVYARRLARLGVRLKENARHQSTFLFVLDWRLFPAS